MQIESLPAPVSTRAAPPVITTSSPAVPSRFWPTSPVGCVGVQAVARAASARSLGPLGLRRTRRSPPRPGAGAGAARRQAPAVRATGAWRRGDMGPLLLCSRGGGSHRVRCRCPAKCSQPGSRGRDPGHTGPSSGQAWSRKRSNTRDPNSSAVHRHPLVDARGRASGSRGPRASAAARTRRTACRACGSAWRRCRRSAGTARPAPPGPPRAATRVIASTTPPSYGVSQDGWWDSAS